MKKRNKPLDKSSKLLALLYSVLIIFPIYGLLGNAYYLDFINGFVFLGVLFIVMAITLILLITFRKHKFKSFSITLVFVLTFLFWVYEARLLSYGSHTYLADSYREPEILLEDSGINILVVGLHDIHYLEDEEMIKTIYEKNGIQILDMYKIKNRDRYRSKTADLKRFLGFGKEVDAYQVMGKNVRNYIDGDIIFIKEFLSRENLTGDSAGLALGLTAMIHQGNLENELSIGVTGTLEPNGDVMKVGGVKAKMMIAEQNGFTFMMIPLANSEEAEAVKAQQQFTMEIIPVSHIDEAVRAIKKLNVE